LPGDLLPEERLAQDEHDQSSGFWQNEKVAVEEIANEKEK
jgi:hypothetical protein